jgi:putrescine transport system substrate-binding protein
MNIEQGFCRALRTVWCGALAALMLLASGALRAQEQLNVANFSDYIGPDVIKKFEKATGIKVSYGIIDSDDTLQAKLLSGRSGYDVVYPTSSYMAKQIEAGIYEPLDWSKIPNRVHLDPLLMKKVVSHDPGNRFGVPYVYGIEGLVVNMTRLREVWGSEPPAPSFDLLFKPEFAAKAAKCGIGLIDSPSNYQAMLAYMGRDPNSTKLADLEAAHKEFLKVRPNVKLFSYNTINDFAAGDLCVATGWSGDYVVMKRRAKAAGKDFDIRFVAPKGQAGLWFTMMGIPKDAANKEAAYKWINFLLSPEIAAETTNHITYPSAVLAAKPLIRPELVNDPILYPSEVQMTDYFGYLSQEDDLLRAYNRMWLRYKSGR